MVHYNLQTWPTGEKKKMSNSFVDIHVLQVRVTNVLDRPFGKMTVTATSAEDTEGTTVLSNKVFTDGPEE